MAFAHHTHHGAPTQPPRWASSTPSHGGSTDVYFESAADTSNQCNRDGRHSLQHDSVGRTPPGSSGTSETSDCYSDSSAHRWHHANRERRRLRRNRCKGCSMVRKHARRAAVMLELAEQGLRRERLQITRKLSRSRSAGQ
eukprot:NODE_610_length_2053_cov_4.863273_g564_i0.p2 GENE.NODE_610_length_2053_cov_4.863273_g564_i0~~NODE_610_length_2053_cov_4.863273_g564_i0.p2  ORF type:complete len:140 (-),score=8.18 NODE_610_length_2053_cov_4.863273_g564_i0:82-501(-)